MTRLHLMDPAIAAASSLSDLCARRRVMVTQGASDLARGAALLVATAGDAAHERRMLDAARAAGVRTVALIAENCARFSVSEDMGGRLLRIEVPTAKGPALTDPGILLLADILMRDLAPMVACDPISGGLIDLAQRVARSDVTVFINGPTGSGKEVLARTVHANSRRATAPFIAINCAAIPENMLEAILFGHDKGAFTGAATANKGLIRAADGGTLLLDEISEMPLGLQAKLLRVIQERRLTPLGSSAEVAVDIRIITTSNRDMPAEVRAGRFREDLYYRLNVFPLATRALASRRDDIAPLAIALMRRHAQPGPFPMFTAEALAALRSHTWPGNVRELENVVQRALVLCDGQTVQADDIVIDLGAGILAPAGLALAHAV